MPRPRLTSLLGFATACLLLTLASPPVLAQAQRALPAFPDAAAVLTDGASSTDRTAEAVDRDRPASKFVKARGGIVVDPSFEASTGPLGSNPFWDGVFAGTLGPFCSPECFNGNPQIARTGIYAVIFGDPEYVGTDFVEQTVTIPDAGDYNFEFFWRGGLVSLDNDSDNEAQGTLRALIDGTTVFELDAQDTPDFSGVYNEVTVPYTATEPTTIVLRFELEALAADQDFVRIYIDDVSLNLLGGGDPELNTGTLAAEILADGYLGANLGNGLGVLFDGENGLFEGQILAGLDPSTVLGQPYADVPEWTTTQAITDIDPPEGYDEAIETIFEAGGVTVALRAFAAQGDPFIILEYEVINNTGGPVSDLYFGPFADWDVGGALGFDDNRGAYLSGPGLLYVFDESGTSANYFGVAALASNEAPVSGWSVSLGSEPTDADLFTALTTAGSDADPAGDRRTVLGTGPWAVDDGASSVARFALVAGADLTAITDAAIAAQRAFPAPAVLATGAVATEALPGGFWGANLGVGTGFVFDDQNGLFEGQFVASVEADEVYGVPYEEDLNGWVATSGPEIATPPMGFDQAFATTFDSDDGVLSVSQLVYGNTDAPYVYIEYTVSNRTGDDLEEVYVGLFADWDVGGGDSFGNDLAGFVEEVNLIYAYDADDPLPYFGVATDVSVGPGISGFTFDADPQADEVELFNGLIEFADDATAPEDRRNLLGVGAFEIDESESITVQFIVVAGEDFLAIRRNAAAAQNIEIDVEETTLAGTYALHSAYPNPFAAQTTLGFTLPEAERVRLDVYDLLGRRVASLVDGVATAGYTAVEFDAAALPSGTYFYRLEAGSTQLTERFTLVR